MEGEANKNEGLSVHSGLTRFATRRSLIVVACAAGLAATMGDLAACSTIASTDEQGPQAGAFAPTTVEAQYGFWMDTETCVGCGLCVRACRESSGTPEDCEARRKVIRYELESGTVRLASTSCMHCARPTCLDVCPAGAIAKRTDGIVVVDQSRCIGCKYCRQACPFWVPHYTTAGMDKCDCCLDAGVPAGKEPYCVQACPTGALHYGSLAALREQAAAVDVDVWQLEAPTEPSLLLS